MIRVVVLSCLVGVWACGPRDEDIDPIEESNLVAQLEDGEVCFADNYDMLSKGWSDSQLDEWCNDPSKWHERMVADKCRECPECCISIPLYP